jgi:hypothetical protein
VVPAAIRERTAVMSGCVTRLPVPESHGYTQRGSDGTARCASCQEPVKATWRNTPSVETGPGTRGVPPPIPVVGAKDKPLVRVR